MKVKSDAKGRFRVRHLAPGRYRLVAMANGFDTGNVAIRAVLWPRGGVLAAKALMLAMTVPAIDGGSWFSYADDGDANR